MLSDEKGGVSECSGSPIFILFIKENWICAMAKHYFESNINPFVPDSPFSGGRERVHWEQIV